MNLLFKAGVGVLLLAGVAQWATSGGESQTPSEADRGAALFRSKGCVTCHTHRDVEGMPEWDAQIGPNLTTYRNDPAFLRRWLADPKAVRPSTTMPDLDLSAPEIEALVAFINRED